MISISLISGGDYPCVQYVLWKLPLCALLLCSLTHYDITVGNDNTMSSDIAMSTYHGITMHNDVAMNLLLCITTPNFWYCWFTSKLLT